MVFKPFIISSSSNLLLMSSIYHDAIATKRSRGRIYSVPYHKHTPNTTHRSTTTFYVPTFSKTNHILRVFPEAKKSICHIPRIPTNSPRSRSSQTSSPSRSTGVPATATSYSLAPSEAEPPSPSPERLDKPRGAFHLATGTSARWIASL